MRDVKIKHIYYIKIIFLVGLFSLSTSVLHSQEVTIALDTTAIKIGEQINVNIAVKADSTSTVVFPKGQTFLPLEIINEEDIDTTRDKSYFKFIKKYGLTQFDSGSYILPAQKIYINNKVFLTDSFKILVNNVEVDTLKQKMFDIKPIIEVDSKSTIPFTKILLIIVVILLLLAILYWAFFRRKRFLPKQKEALLPPFDRALLSLKKLETSKYLIQSEYKQYYSELTDIVRLYLEEEVHISALESTTSQLIDKLELLKNEGNLRLDNHTIKQFENVLKTADLVKFAKSQPQTSIAEKDREIVEDIVKKTKQALPEPTQEELLQQEEYQKKQANAKKKTKLIYVASGILALLVLSGGIAIYNFGFKNVKDTILRNPSKLLLDKEWVISEYGYPGFIVETPDVLIRNNNKTVLETLQSDTLTQAQIDFIKKNTKDIFKKLGLEIKEFVFEDRNDIFYIKLTDLAIKDKMPDIEEEVKSGLESFIKEKQARNVIDKQEPFRTPKGAEGIKQYGTAEIKNSKNKYENKKYIILYFATKGYTKRFLMFWNNDDAYADEISKRILNSIELKTE